MAYFHCRSVIRGENKATPYSEKSEDIRPLSLFKADPIFSGDPLRYQRTLGAIYAGIVTEFTRKKLSFPHDVLNAFSGIAATMEKLCSWQLVAGMPESILDYALLWLPSKSSRRRCQELGTAFPSWSWAGWHSEADYNTILRAEANYEPYLAGMESIIYGLHIYDQHGFRSIQSLVPLNEKLAIDARNSLHTVAPEWLNYISNSQMPKNGLLFRALTFPAEGFTVEQMSNKTSVSTSQPTQAPVQQMIVRFYVRGYSDVGHLFCADLEIPTVIQSSSCDIVFLSTINAVGEDFGNFHYGNNFTNFMLIQWKGDFAERISVGLYSGMLMKAGKKEIYYFGAESHNIRNCQWKTIRLI
jgi:hypothetical protein